MSNARWHQRTPHLGSSDPGLSERSLMAHMNAGDLYFSILKQESKKKKALTDRKHPNERSTIFSVHVTVKMIDIPL